MSQSKTVTSIAPAPAAPAEPPSLLNIIAEAARDPNVDVAKLTALIGLQERVQAQQAERAFIEAMGNVAELLEPVRRDARNPTFNRKYATLDAVDGMLRPHYSAHGFHVSYGARPASDGHVCITCTVWHRGGHRITECLTAPLDTQSNKARTPLQAVGSAITYLRRYLLVMAFNVAMLDDDGESTRQADGASRPPAPTQITKPQPRPANGHQGDVVEYPLIGVDGKNNPHATGSDWIATWKMIVKACRENQDAGRLQKAWEANRKAMDKIAAFDPQAIAEVRDLVQAAIKELSTLPSKEEMQKIEARQREPGEEG